MATGKWQLVAFWEAVLICSSQDLRLRRRRRRKVQSHHLFGERCLRYEQDTISPTSDSYSPNDRDARECHYHYRRYIRPTAGEEYTTEGTAEVKCDTAGLLRPLQL